MESREEQHENIFNSTNSTTYLEKKEKLENHLQIIKKIDLETSSAQGENIVLIVGMTGAGKSTIINYLLDCKMKKNSAGCLVPEGKIFAKMGNDLSSETSFPHTYYSEQDKIAYCDVAGFKDSRGEEKRVSASIGLQMVTQKARSIRSIIVVINHADIESLAGQNFKKLNVILSQIILKSPSEIKESILFLVNKAPSDVKHESLKERFENMCTNYHERLCAYIKNNREERWGEEQLEEYEILSTLSIIKENFMIINVCDNGESKKHILSKLATQKIVNKNFINFDKFSKERLEFNKDILQIVNQGLDIMKERKSLFDKIEKKITKFHRLNRKISRGNKKLKMLVNNSFESSDEYAEIKQEKIQEKCDKKIKLKEDIASLQDELNLLTSEKLVKVWEERVRKLPIIKFIKPKLEKTFNYKGQAYDKVELNYDQTKGKLTPSSDNDPDKGIYSAEYFSNSGSPATVSIFIKEKNRPDNQKLIGEKEEEIKLKRRELLNIEEKIHRLDKKNVKAILKKQKREDTEEKNKRAEKEKHVLKNEIVILQKRFKEIETILLGEKNEKVSSQNFTLYRIVYEIIKIIKFDSEVINNFQKNYHQLLSNNKKKQDIFEKFDASLSSSLSESCSDKSSPLSEDTFKEENKNNSNTSVSTNASNDSSVGSSTDTTSSTGRIYANPAHAFRNNRTTNPQPRFLPPGAVPALGRTMPLPTPRHRNSTPPADNAFSSGNSTPTAGRN